MIAVRIESRLTAMPPLNGRSSARIRARTRPISAASAQTIRACAAKLRTPKKYVKATEIIAPTISTLHIAVGSSAPLDSIRCAAAR